MDDELKALTATLSAYYSYGRWAYDDLVRPRKVKLNSLSVEEASLVPWYKTHLDHITECLQINESFTKNLALSIAPEWGVSADPSQWEPPTSEDFDKVRSMLLQLSREWSDDFVDERSSFAIIKDHLKDKFPNKVERQNIKVLVPGCGTGRLVYELVKEGFWTQGNEFSYHMLLASNFILNHSFVAHNYSIFPYLHKFSHLKSRNHQIRPVTIPDINPADIMKDDSSSKSNNIPYSQLMSMAAGSFVDLYGPQKLDESDVYSNSLEAQQFRDENKNKFDAIATCYFLDTSSNIIEYIKSIHHSLKSGGYWINFGPLLWHFENDGNMSYINRNGEQVPTSRKGLELSRDDLLELVQKMGFELEKVEDVEDKYCTDPRALGAYTYNCLLWVARKK